MLYFKWYLIIWLIVAALFTVWTLVKWRSGMKFSLKQELQFGIVVAFLWPIAIPGLIIDWLAVHHIIPLYDRK